MKARVPSILVLTPETKVTIEQKTVLVPGKGIFVIVRLCGPTQAFFDHLEAR
jgi:hypothetical protein